MPTFNQTIVLALKNMDGSGFSPSLLRLIAKADFENLAKLREAFPEYVEAYEAWHDSPTEQEFYDKHLGSKGAD